MSLPASPKADAFPARAMDLGLASCRGCSLVTRLRVGIFGRRHCPRCGKLLYARKPGSLTRSWAFLAGAALLYLPANVLPIMSTSQFSEHRSDTILSGVVHLWESGSWDLSLIVFAASIVLPMLKMGALFSLFFSAQRKRVVLVRQHAFVFHIMERIGHWSMLDVFVVALLVTLVKFGAFADVEPESGALAFAGVVSLTMLASSSFDARLLWDAEIKDEHGATHSAREANA